MYEAQIYDKTKGLQVGVVKDALERYFHLVKLRPECDDKILDVGCGDGEIMVEHLFKRFSNKDETIVGGDKSLDMLNYSKDKYKNRDKITFRLLDIVTKTLPNNMIQEFDHIFTFSCLNWVTDLTQAVKNFNNLLKPKGNLFVISPTKNGLFQAYHDIPLGDSKWAKYFIDAEQFVPKYHFAKHPEEEFANLLTKSGFNVVISKHLYREHTFNSLTECKQFYDSLNPFKRNIPAKELPDYYDYLLSCMQEKKWLEMRDDGRPVAKIYNLFTYATKC